MAGEGVEGRGARAGYIMDGEVQGDSSGGAAQGVALQQDCDSTDDRRKRAATMRQQTPTMSGQAHRGLLARDQGGPPRESEAWAWREARSLSGRDAGVGRIQHTLPASRLFSWRGTTARAGPGARLQTAAARC